MKAGQDFQLATALDPSRSVVVDACAGSGKTWLLVSRVIRLLLADVAPSEILAITFTRKAAQELRARLTDWLRTLALGSDDDVGAFLRERAVPEADVPAALLRARGLFEACVNAQPGVTIDTFHGWFLQLLERAPLNADAGVPGDFALEERVSLLLDEAWDRFGAALEDAANVHVATKFAELAADLGYSKLRTLLGRFLHRRAEWWAYTLGHSDPVAFALSELRQLLAVDPDADPARRLLDDPSIKDCLNAFAGLNSSKSKTQANFAEAIRLARAQQDATQAFSILFAGCHTKEGAPQKNLAGFYAKQDSAMSARFDTFCARLQATRAALDELAVYRLHERALPCGALLLDVFQQLKRARQVIDFTDIEWLAYRLLANGEDAAFMHAKLDSRYRHILLDEFQDTNPLQWQALRSWLDAYGDAAGRPSVFLVGDPKQSIYRFRRAEPRLFEVAAETLVRDYGAARLTHSVTRRCAPEIVDVVNAMFCDRPEYPGFVRHTAHEATPGGRVEVVPLFRHPPVQIAEAEGDWRDPLKRPLRDREDLRRNLEAGALAARVRDIVGKWEVVDAAGARPARYADIMILKRNRTHLPAYEHALRVLGIPFLTSRQGGLLGTLEAADLCALIEVLIAPFDDLKLAHTLRSPVFACSDDDLIMLARRAAGSIDKATWWQCLAAIAPEASPDLRRAHRLLADWRAAADAAPVHDLLDRIYHEGDVTARYRAASPVATQGQVTANLQRFLELALELDSGRYPSLPRFVAELARLREIPDQEAPDEGQETANDERGVGGDRGLDAVRILTVHGAKGLEAPLVWLIDAQEGQRAESYDVLIDWPPEASAPGHFSLFTVIADRGHRRDHLFQTQSDLAAREKLNLLYVAATRARRYLVVSGVEAENAAQRISGSAYERIAFAVDEVATSRGEPQIAVVGKIAMAVPLPSPLASTPAATPAPPSRSSITHGRRVAQSKAGRAGSLLHRALEFAGNTKIESSEGDRREVARRALGLPENEFAPLWEQALDIVNAPGLRRFFDVTQFRRAENEVELIGEDGLKRIDRLVEFDEEVWVLDYKSGFDDRAGWNVQLASYRAMLKPLFAHKKVRTAVVLVDGGLEEFSD